MLFSVSLRFRQYSLFRYVHVLPGLPSQIEYSNNFVAVQIQSFERKPTICYHNLQLLSIDPTKVIYEYEFYSNHNTKINILSSDIMSKINYFSAAVSNLNYIERPHT